MNTTSTSSQTSATLLEKSFGFWGNLKLPRKFMLIFGVVLAFTLLAVGIALWGLTRVEAGYEHALAQGDQIQYLSEETMIYFLQARRQEKNFLSRWQDEGFDTAYANYVTLYKEHMVNMHGTVNALAPFGSVAGTLSTGEMTQEEYDADITSLTELTNTYDQNFLALVDAMEQKGADENTGMQLVLRDAAHAIENKVTAEEGLEQLEITLLQIRRNEKDYLLRSDQEYIDNVHNLAAQLKAQAALSEIFTASQKTEMNKLVDEYTQAFDAIVEKDKEIAAYNENMIASARAVEPFAIKIENLGEQLASEDFTSAREISAQTITTSVIVMAVILALSIFLSIVLSRQITLPVTHLAKTAEAISGGNFDVEAEIASGDEIGTLAQTFNTMTSRLRQAFEDVNRRSKDLATVARISTSVATIRDPFRMLETAVHLTQRGFNLYHAHVFTYHKDEDMLQIVACGYKEGDEHEGTHGTARIPVTQEQSLVARAARTRKPVIVNDVRSDPGWLPNPLLPDTHAELAVPMIVGNELLGVLDVQADRVDAFSEESANIQMTLAAQIATALQNAQSYNEAETRAELETLVNTIGQKIQRAATVEETLQTAIRELGTAIGASRVKAYLGLSSDNDSASKN